MKCNKVLFALSVSIGLGSSFNGFAQSSVPPYHKAYLEANNIRSSINTLGTMWYDLDSGRAECEYPKGSGKNIGFSGGLWLGGYDQQGNLRASAALYNDGGKQDYFPGALDANGLIDTASVRLWRHVWNMRRGTIDSFRAVFNSIGAGNPTALQAALSSSSFDDLKGWPAKGSQTAAGNNGQTISTLATAPRDYAPFVDVDGDGKYNYMMGDYPKIKGDQMLWMIMNDMGGLKTQTNIRGISLEIQLSAYAYARNPIVNNIQFYEYKINHYGSSSLTLDTAVATVFADMDLGYGFDDYIGFDSSHRMGYVYNGDDTDGNGSASHYGANPPIGGVVLLETVGDIGTIRVPAGAFTYFSNATGSTPPALQDPQNGLECYRYMTGTNRFGQFFTNDFTGICNVNTVGYGSGPATKTVFPGDPAVRPSWSECCSNNPPGDRRFILSSAPFQMLAGSSYNIAFALVVAPGGGCPNINLANVQETADSAIQVYNNPNYATAVQEISPFAEVKLFPNPATEILVVQNLPSASTSVQVLDVTGRKITLSQQQKGKDVTLNTAALSAGVYLLQITSENAVETRRFVKE